MVGLYTKDCNNSVDLPVPFKKYGGPTIGWNSLDKLGAAMTGKSITAEKPDGTLSTPRYTIERIKC